MYIKPLKIGNVIIKNNIFLAPMAGVTDLTFRLICKRFGADGLTTEMISAKGLYYKETMKAILSILLNTQMIKELLKNGI